MPDSDHPNQADPVADEDFPNVVRFDALLDNPNRFPDTWGTKPTKRDRGSIRAHLRKHGGDQE